MKKSVPEVAMKSYEELFGISNQEQKNADQGELMEVEISQLHSFAGHPFRVRKDTRFMETLESIQKVGILEPGIVRDAEGGGYEIIAGHRRRECCLLLGKATMPVFKRNVSDEDAAIMMSDSNLYREDISYSEKAWAYRIKFDALKAKRERERRKARREEEADGKIPEPDGKVAELIRSDNLLAKEFGESRNKIQRYIRLTYLKEELLDLVDDKKLGFVAGADLSFLSGAKQDMLYQFMMAQSIIPSGPQAATIKEYHKKGELNLSVLELLLQKETTKTAKLVLPDKTLRRFFPESYETEQMEEIIMELLEEWSQGKEH